MSRHMTKNELDHWYTLKRWPCGHGSSNLFIFDSGVGSFQQFRCRTCGLCFRVLREEHPRLPFGEILAEPEGYKQPRRVWSETHLWRSIVGPRKYGLRGRGSLVKLAQLLTMFYLAYCVGIFILLYETNKVRFGILGLIGLFPCMLVFTMVKRLIKGEKK